MPVLESVAAVLGLICVALVARRSLWNYPFGIASTGLLFVVFGDARLYSDALLQIFFVAVNLYGWWNWQRARDELGEVAVEVLTPRARIAWAVGCALAVLLWGALMHRFTDASYPWIDAVIAIVSVAAQVLQARRRIDSWVLWIAVDVVAVPLFLVKQLPVAAMLYAVYLGLSVWGLIDWTRARRRAAIPA